ncbi:thiamine ABC transporter permease [[Bacillus] enclensis]|jgi:energy-coupling factor transport system permease protein|uniref:Energy-coupling factor transport system substrate-specific component n=2 Tax=Rossellomorea TaxID=2837508 RepID=A0A0V8HKA8_9BACI|nr:ECF transporter S component [[Bacillus] enclensis]OAT82508.1 thiamine ABC transporter permease [Bacillus sp. MKU004]QTC42752.1 ECF transporter S component [Bacillus sp. V3]QWC20944.1 ECF transporter S component [Bacillus haikouensis]KSU62850.1 thiamine ABC transporter permease [[Bacillus] enclensis]MBH9965082.1 ECF transporter S component [[Bacillus] enclensis]
MAKLKLTDILVTVVISIGFGIIYKVWGPLYNMIKPFGLHADQLIYGMWFMAATVAFLIIRKPGVALLAEIAASSGEFLMGSEWGLEVLLFGVVQGLFAEAVFFVTKYKRNSLFIISLAAVMSAFGSILMDSYKGYIGDLAVWNLLLFLGARLLGSILISGMGAFYLVKALERTGVTSLVRPAEKEDYEALDR